MKKAISLALLTLAAISAYPQTAVVSVNEKSDWTTVTPIIPLEVAAKGRQAVADNLMMQVARVDIGFSGASVMPSQWNQFQSYSLAALYNLGYTHIGMFTELSDALAGIPFSGQVIQTPRGNYEVNVNVNYFTDDSRMAFSGNGSLYIVPDGNGGLTAGTFQPWMCISSQIAVKRPGQICAAKWIGVVWGQEENLPVSYNGTDSYVLIQTRMLEDGYIVFADQNGNVTAWDLKTANELKGKQLLTFLGQSYSSDMRSLKNPVTIDAGSVGFYQCAGYVFGRFPMTDLVTDKPMKQVLSFTVPVWGTTMKIAPSKIFITPVYLNDNGRSGLQTGTEYELPWRADLGGWILSIPAGGFHIRVEFDSVLDWESNPYSIG